MPDKMGVQNENSLYEDKSVIGSLDTYYLDSNTLGLQMLVPLQLP